MNPTPTPAANEIINLIGQISLYMIGATYFEYSESGMSFRFFGSVKFNHLSITISEDEESFTLVFSKVRYDAIRPSTPFTKVIECVLYDNIKQVIEKETGLFTYR